MKAVVDISMYPVSNEFIAHIDAFIHSLKKDSTLKVTVGNTATVIEGEYDHLMNVLTQEMKKSFENVPCAFNLRILGGSTADIPNPHK